MRFHGTTLWTDFGLYVGLCFGLAGTRIVANLGAYPNEYEPPLFVADRIIEV